MRLFTKSYISTVNPSPNIEELQVMQVFRAVTLQAGAVSGVGREQVDVLQMFLNKFTCG